MTVAGTVGTWWYEPEGRTSCCCSKAVLDSLTRSVTYSFGSVGLGSLLVGIVQPLRRLCNPRCRPWRQQDQDQDGCVVIVMECLLRCMPGYWKCISDWAYVYVGLYGHGFIHATQKVLVVVHNNSREWTTVLTNSWVVTLVNLMVGALTGLVSLVVGYAAFGVLYGLFYRYVLQLYWLLVLVSWLGSCVSHTHSLLYVSTFCTVSVLCLDTCWLPLHWPLWMVLSRRRLSVSSKHQESWKPTIWNCTVA